MPSPPAGIRVQGRRVMALSSGARRAASMAAGWLVAAGAGAFSLVYFSEIKEAARSLLGIPRAGDVQAVAARRVEGAPVPSMAALRHGRVVEIKAGVHGHYYAS